MKSILQRLDLSVKSTASRWYLWVFGLGGLEILNLGILTKLIPYWAVTLITMVLFLCIVVYLNSFVKELMRVNNENINNNKELILNRLNEVANESQVRSDDLQEEVMSHTNRVVDDLYASVKLDTDEQNKRIEDLDQLIELKSKMSDENLVRTEENLIVKLNDSENKNESKLNKLHYEIDMKIKSNHKDISQNLEDKYELMNSKMSDGHKSLNEMISDKHVQVQEKLKEVNSELNNRLMNNQSLLLTEISSLSDQIKNKIDEDNSLIKSKIDNSLAELNSKILEEEKQVEEKFAETANQINVVQEVLSTKLIDSQTLLQMEISSSLDHLKKQIDEDNGEIKTKIDNSLAELNSKMLQEEKQIKEKFVETSNQIKTVEETLSTKLIDSQTLLQREITNSSDHLKNKIDEDNSGIKFKIDNSLAELNSKMLQEEKQIEEKFVETANQIKSVQEKFTETANQIKTVEETLSTKLIDSQTLLQTEISNSSDHLKKQIDEDSDVIKTKLESGLADLYLKMLEEEKQVEEKFTEATNQINVVQETLSTKLMSSQTLVQTEISKSSEQLSNKIEEVNSIIKVKIDNGLAELSSKISQEEKQIEEKFVETANQIKTVEEKFAETTNQINVVQETLSTKIIDSQSLLKTEMRNSSDQLKNKINADNSVRTTKIDNRLTELYKILQDEEKNVNVKFTETTNQINVLQAIIKATEQFASNSMKTEINHLISMINTLSVSTNNVVSKMSENLNAELNSIREHVTVNNRNVNNKPVSSASPKKRQGNYTEDIVDEKNNILVKNHYSNDKLKTSEMLEKGKLVFKTEYDNDGLILKSYNYNDKKKSLMEILYHPNGQVKERIETINIGGKAKREIAKFDHNGKKLNR